MKICAIVPTYNRKDLLVECLKSLLLQSRPLDEIIVVDNASTDGTAETVSRNFGDRMTYIGLSENLGSAGGFYEGMKIALEHGHDWIWCMDNDAIPLRDTLAKLIEADGPFKGQVVAKACSRTDPETGESFLLGEVVDFERGRIVKIKRADWKGKTILIDAAPWAGLLVKAEIIRRAGLPRVGMFSWGDDFAFCFELRKFGEILHVDTTTLLHPGPGRRLSTQRKFGRERVAAEEYWKLYYAWRNRLYLGKVYYKGKWLWLTQSLARYFRILLAILLMDDFKLYRMKMATKAFMDGLTGRLGKSVEPDDFTVKYGCRRNRSEHLAREMERQKAG